MYYVYVLRSQGNGRLYTGSTEDVVKRLSEHNSGHTLSTQLTRPFDLVYSEKFDTRAEAVRREKFFKSGLGRQQLKRLIPNNL